VHGHASEATLGVVEWDLLSTLAEADRRQVLAAGRRRRFERGEVVFHEGDAGDVLHLLAKGHVAVRVTTPMGDVALLHVLGPGDFFGELAAVSLGPRSATVVCLDATETLSLRRDHLDDLRHTHPGVNDRRVWRRLAELSDLYGPPVDGRVVVPLTQEDLAHLAGTTRPTANRTLKSGEDAGLLRIARGRIEVLDLAQVAERGR
jgi:CRP-like cAMP-binding protein